MKWLYLLISKLIPLLISRSVEQSHPIEDFKELLKENAVKILLLFTAAMAVGTFFVAGVVITIFNFAIQYDFGQQLRMTAITKIGIAFIAFSTLVFLFGIFFATKHEREKKRMEGKRAKQGQPNTIQEAVLLLVNDYIAEKEFEREYKRTLIRNNTDQLRPQQEFYNGSNRPSDTYEKH